MYTYKNGNYQVTLEDNGTKTRETFNPNESFMPEFPEQMDVKVTNSCDWMCRFCHENSIPNGKHANLEKFLEKTRGLNKGTEFANGGGCLFKHPQLTEYLQELKNRDFVANGTANELDLIPYKKQIEYYLSENLIKGMGLSYRVDNSNHDALIEFSKYPYSIIHVIVGVDTVSDISKLVEKLHTKNILLLGYKDFRRGVLFHKRNPEIDKNIREWYNLLPLFVNKVNKDGGIVSFDNLAIEQLNVRRILSQDEWNLFYQGKDGMQSGSLYIDAVEEKFALNSCAEERFNYLDNIVNMFKFLKEKYQ